MPDYVSQIASATGLAKQAPPSPFFDKAGVAAGLMDGYIVVVEPKPHYVEHEGSVMRIMVRTGGIKSPAEARSALQGLFRGRSELTVDSDSVTILWAYVLQRPPAEKVRALLMDVLAGLHPYASSCSKCETCGSTQAGDIFYRANEPVWLCSSCRQKWLDAESDAEKRYAALPVHLGRAGWCAGILCVAGGEGIARMWHASRSISPFFWSAAVLGLLIGLITAASAGKTTRTVKALAYAATLAGVWIAYFRSFALNDPSHPVRQWEIGRLLLAFMMSLWFLWLPLFLTWVGFTVWEGITAYTAGQREVVTRVGKT